MWTTLAHYVDKRTQIQTPSPLARAIPYMNITINTWVHHFWKRKKKDRLRKTHCTSERTTYNFLPFPISRCTLWNKNTHLSLPGVHYANDKITLPTKLATDQIIDCHLKPNLDYTQKIKIKIKEERAEQSYDLAVQAHKAGTSWAYCISDSTWPTDIPSASWWLFAFYYQW